MRSTKGAERDVVVAGQPESRPGEDCRGSRGSGRGTRRALVGLVTALLVLPPGGARGLVPPTATATVAGPQLLTQPGTGALIRIVRDGFGVPHIYAETTAAAAYGIGYAQAADKLWLLHLLRIVAGGHAVDLVGPIPELMDQDDAVRLVSYTKAERASQLARLPPDVLEELRAFVAGINQYMDEATIDPDKLPLEFVTFGALPLQRWTVDDVMALWGYLVADPAGFPPALGQTNLLARLKGAYGAEIGRAKFEDLVRAVDPDTAVTVPDGTAWRGAPTGAPPERLAGLRTIASDARLGSSAAGLGLELPRFGLPVSPPSAPTEAARQAALQQAVEDTERFAALQEAGLLRHLFGSNATAIAPKLSATQNAAITAGPQTAYTVPASYYEYGVHVPGRWETVGMTAPGVLYHVIARTARHAWTVTNGASTASVDWFEERLNPDNAREYWFRDRYEPMECRTEIHTARAVPYRTQEVCRTRHGPVFSFNETAGLAYAQRLPWFDREYLSIAAFRGLGRAQTFEDAAVSVGLLSGNYNILYANADGRVAYWHAGFFPDRHDQADIRLVQPGDGSREWDGLLAFDQQPHVLDPKRGWLANWNNGPARDWPEARSQPAQHRLGVLERGFRDGAITPAPVTGGVVNPDQRWSAAELAKNLEAAAYGHVRPGGCNCSGGLPYFPFVSAAPSLDHVTDPLVREALAVISSWDGQAVDRDGDGFIESAAPLIMETWIDIAHREAFADDLAAGDLVFARPNGELWQLLSPASQALMGYDWLNGESQENFRARTFTAAVQQLTASRSGSPASWKKRMSQQSYDYFNHHFLLELANDNTCSATGGVCPSLLREDLALEAARLGYVEPHDAMNRGRFNYVVAWQDPPHKPGARVSACSINTSGNSQFISATGQESPWFRDQVGLYTHWQWKAFPLSDQDVAAALAPSTCEPAR